MRSLVKGYASVRFRVCGRRQRCWRCLQNLDGASSGNVLILPNNLPRFPVNTSTFFFYASPHSPRQYMQYKRYTFMHNGGIPGFGRMKRQLMALLRDEAYQAIEGTTDSEVREGGAGRNEGRQAGRQSLPCGAPRKESASEHYAHVACRTIV